MIILMSDITDYEIKKFVSYISEQNDNKPVGKYLDEMTSEMFYEYCSMGYELNQIGIKIDMYRQEYRFTPAFAFIQAV